MSLKWILRDDGVLCADGYPIRIALGGQFPFILVSDRHGTALPYFTLASAKHDAERLALEIDEFTPSMPPDLSKARA